MSLNVSSQPRPADWVAGFEPCKTKESQLPFYLYTRQLERLPSDTRQYRLLRLPNNMKVLCIQDEIATHATAAVTVNVGSIADPPEFQGLAHLLEHVITMGSQKYPVEKEYDDFISSNAGNTNATTDRFFTKYDFSIANTALHGALDRLASCLANPLLAEDSIAREIHAVDSEHTGYKKDEVWRYRAVISAISDPSHHLSHFMVGNLESLRGSAGEQKHGLCEHLKKFHSTYYSSDIMSLVVAGDHTLDQLTEWAVSLFSPIQSKGNNVPSYPFHHFNHELMGSIVRIKTLKNVNVIRLIFRLPELKAYYYGRLPERLTHKFFHELRSMEQLGYSVDADTLWEFITDNTYNFDKSAQIAESMKKMAVDEIKNPVKLMSTGTKQYENIGMYQTPGGKWVINNIDDVVAAGLQRQLDELRQIIAQFKAEPTEKQQQQQGEGQRACDSDNSSAQAEEIKKLNTRIKHLLRALDAKDKTIEALQSANNQQ
ncbi:metalloprotease [Coemansia sp. Benny D115]|nr:metalloprotease [Coemansia sp. Benny D115]